MEALEKWRGCVCVCVFVWGCMYVCVCECMCVNVCVCVRARMYGCVYVCVWMVCVCTCVYESVCVREPAYTRAYVGEGSPKEGECRRLATALKLSRGFQKSKKYQDFLEKHYQMPRMWPWSTQKPVSRSAMGKEWGKSVTFLKTMKLRSEKIKGHRNRQHFFEEKTPPHPVPVLQSSP